MLGCMARTNGTASHLANDARREFPLKIFLTYSLVTASHGGTLVGTLDHASHSMGEPTEEAIRTMCSLA